VPEAVKLSLPLDSSRLPSNKAVPTDAEAFKIEEPFRIMVEAIADYAVFMLDANGFVSTWNKGAERFKGFTADQIIGKHFSTFYPPESIKSGVPQAELAIAAEKGRYEDENWRIRRNGARFWAHIIITALRDSSGQLIGFVKVARELTERRIAEQIIQDLNDKKVAIAAELASLRLAAEQQRSADQLDVAYAELRSVMDSTTDNILQIGTDWRILYGNQRAANSLFGFEVGKDLWSCLPTLFPEPVEQKLRASMEQRIQNEYENFSAHGDHWYQGHIFPIPNGISIFFRDITSEKNMQSQLELEQLLREKRIEALSHMAGGLAHEISNPLAIMHARASDLRTLAAADSSDLALNVRTACDSIVTTSDRAIKILRGLRGFAREASKDPMEFASIESIVAECTELQQTRFDRHDVQLRLNIEPKIPAFEARPVQIGQIITNLLNNAFDAIVQSNSVERWIRLNARLHRDCIILDVSDSGPGIEDHFKAHLMEPFFTTKELGLGMGVGLSLSRTIAEDHGGSLVLLKDTFNTSFRLTLPLIQYPPKQDPANDMLGVPYQD
jgi:PAS domain S-box-containing protein